MLKYTFSLLIVFLFSIIGHAQTKDTTKIEQRYGLRVGIDLHRLSKSFYDKDYNGLEIIGDYRITKKFYIAVEAGQEEKTVKEDRFNFTTKGEYIKVGFDYNTYQNWLDMENMIHLGIRYGFGKFNHTLHTYKIYDTTNYYGENIVTSGEKFNNLNASWIEIVGGVKAKIVNNLYLGFSVRLNYLVHDKKPINFENLYIPGYNRTYDAKFGAGFNYSLSYMIPFYSKK